MVASETPLFPELDSADAPLAHRMRPTSLDEFLGQRHLLATGKPLRAAIERGTLGSIVLWGPPGCGKTTLAKLVARYTDRHFETFSAVTEGVPRVREIIREAKARQASSGRGTILFCDEIHRFNKAQQDAFLPHVEAGVITLIGATTENPSFELNTALLSRMRVFVLEPIDRSDLITILRKAVERLAKDSPADIHFEDAALELLATHADGDARRALNAIEALWQHFAREASGKGRKKRGPGEGDGRAASRRRAGATDAEGDAQASAPGPARTIDADAVAEALERRVARFDKSGEEHFNQISALHKAVRGSDVEGALYWLARMLAGGEDPMYLLRRLARMASEDIGLADPRALNVALRAKDAYHFLGSPEGELAIAEACIYLATAPKSNSAYRAWGEARAAASEYPAEPVPLHIRNAPTGLMRNLGYGKGYRYDHDEGGFAAGQEYLPDALAGAKWFEPGPHGFEKTLAERIERWNEMKEAARKDRDD